MRYDLIASFYRKAEDKEPRYYCPLGIISESRLGWSLQEWGFKEDPDSTPGYLDYINRDFWRDDLHLITSTGYFSELKDVMEKGEPCERVDVSVMEIDTIDDEGTLPPFGLFVHGTFVQFGATDPQCPVCFIDGDPYELMGGKQIRHFSVPLGKLKEYFQVLTMYEVRDRFRDHFAKSRKKWTFDGLKKYFESI